VERRTAEWLIVFLLFFNKKRACPAGQTLKQIPKKFYNKWDFKDGDRCRLGE
jgi:hypothetical protein